MDGKRTMGTGFYDRRRVDHAQTSSSEPKWGIALDKSMGLVPDQQSELVAALPPMPDYPTLHALM